MQARAALATSGDWREALEEVLSAIESAGPAEVWDLCFLFASDSYVPALSEVVKISDSRAL